MALDTPDHAAAAPPRNGRARRRARRARRARRLRRTTATLALLAIAASAAAVLLPTAAGFERYVITGGSMGDSLPRGSIAYAREVPAAAIRRGDVITYRPPGHARLVTHRVVWTGRDATGARALRTRGDANKASDPWRFTLTAPTQARVIFHLPVAGYAVAALAHRPVRMALLGGPALLIALAAFAGLWRTATNEAKSA